MATHSSNLVWRVPWTEEPGRLQGIILTQGSKLRLLCLLQVFCVLISLGYIPKNGTAGSYINYMFNFFFFFMFNFLRNCQIVFQVVASFYFSTGNL